jgi:hypothetical protein
MGLFAFTIAGGVLTNVFAIAAIPFAGLVAGLVAEVVLVRDMM